jgi:ABC-2 type transport system ATP-binding protein
MILDEPTLGLDVVSRKSFYEMLIDEWCDGERSVLISTHQVEEVEALLSDVIMLDEGRVALSISLEDIDRRFVALNHDPAAADAMAAAHPLLRYREQGRTTSLFDGVPPEHITSLGQRVRPSLVDLFMALTRNPALNGKQA